MKAVVVNAYGPPASLRYQEYPDPDAPGPDEVLIRIAAAGVNPADARLMSGEYPDLWPSFPRVNGRDVAGVVEAVGSGVTEYAVGDRVYGFSEIHWAGTWADLMVMPAAWIGHAPKTISLAEAAALPVVALTAWETLFIDFPALERGQTVLINGAAGGVGSMVVQMAKAVGAHVIGSASTGKLEFLKDLGCDQVIDYTKTPVEAVVENVDAVVDNVGGDSLRRSYALVRKGGWLASVSGPVDPEEVERRGIIAAQTRGRVVEGLLTRLAAEVDQGRLGVRLSATYPMAQASTALAEVAKGHTLGKIVLVNT